MDLVGMYVEAYDDGANEVVVSCSWGSYCAVANEIKCDDCELGLVMLWEYLDDKDPDIETFYDRNKITRIRALLMVESSTAREFSFYMLKMADIILEKANNDSA